MTPFYYVISADSGEEIPANIREAQLADYVKTVKDRWQTSWMSEYLQDEALEKYALEIVNTGELIGLGAYRNMPDGVLVYGGYRERTGEQSYVKPNEKISRNRSSAAGVWNTAFCRLRLWRLDLSEGKNIRNPGTLHKRLWGNTVQPSRSVFAFD